MKILLTLGIYVLIIAMLYTGVMVNFEHDEVETNASLICYACIGVD